MSLATAGQSDAYQSLKPSPEVEINSLQLTKQPALHPDSPNIKSESPIVNDTLLSDLSQIPKTMETKLEMSISDISLSEVIGPNNTMNAADMRGKLSDSRQSTPQTATNPLSVNRSKSVEVGTPSAIDSSKVSAYARLEFENFIFYVQTLQVVLGRKSEHDNTHSVDVHLGASKAISRKHAKIFYNFGTERFELSIQGKNGAFVDDAFIERGATVPLINKSKVQIGQIVFRFVLPGSSHQENTESPSKAINPSDAISLRSTLYTNHKSDTHIDEESDEATPPLTSKDFEPVQTGISVEKPPTNTQPDAITNTTSNNTISLTSESSVKKDIISQSNKPVPIGPVPNTITSAQSEGDVMSKKSKEKKAPKPPKPPKKVYSIEEIPEDYRTKPACSYSNLIATCLRTHGTSKGMSLAEIYKSIRDLFPYYQYCADGWQSSVRHNLSLNKAFRKVSKEGKGWLWGLDEEYCAEKERAKKKQIAAAAAKAKAAALKIEQQQQMQTQKLEQQKPLGDQFVQTIPGNQKLPLNLNLQNLPLPDLSNISNLSAQALQGQQLLNTVPNVSSQGSGPLSLPLSSSDQKQNILLQPNSLSPQLQLSPQVQATLLQQLQQNIQLRGLPGFPPGTNISNQTLIEAQAKLLAGQFPLQPLPQQPQQSTQAFQPQSSLAKQPLLSPQPQTQLSQPLQPPQLHQTTQPKQIRPDPSQIPVFKSSKPIQPIQPDQAIQAVRPPQSVQTGQYNPSSAPLQTTQLSSTGPPGNVAQSVQKVQNTKSVQQPNAANMIAPTPTPVFKEQQLSSPNPQYQQSNKVPSIQAQLAANRGVSSTGSGNSRATSTPTASSPASNKPIGADTKKALAHLQQQLVLLSRELRNLVDKPTISAILTQAIAMTIAQVTQAAKTKGLTTDPLATLIETNPNQLTRILTVALNAATFKVTNGRIKNPISLQPANPNSNSSSRAATPVPPKTKTPVPQIPKFTPNANPQPSFAQSNIPTPKNVPVKVNAHQNQSPQYQIQPIQPIKAIDHAPKPQPVQRIPIRVSKVPTHSQALITSQPSTLAATAAVISSGHGTNTSPSTAEFLQNSVDPQTNKKTPQPEQALRGSSDSSASSSTVTGGVPQFQHSVSDGIKNSISGPYMSIPETAKAETVDKTSDFSVNITAPTESFTTHTKEDFSQVQNATGKVSQGAAEMVSSLPTADNSSKPKNVMSNDSINNTGSTTNIASPNIESVTISDVKNVKAPIELKTQTLRELETSAGKPTDSLLSAKPAPEFKLENTDRDGTQATGSSISSIDESLKFLEEDLNDPEFSKVLESLSKEGTPDVEDTHVMNDEELNRLLSSDFPEINAPNTTTNSSAKRTFNEIDIPEDVESTKFQRI